jgi:hypothetical protein
MSVRGASRIHDTRHRSKRSAPFYDPLRSSQAQAQAHRPTQGYRYSRLALPGTVPGTVLGWLASLAYLSGTSTGREATVS